MTWQIFENSYFVQHFSFSGGDSDQFLENSSIFFEIRTSHEPEVSGTVIRIWLVAWMNFPGLRPDFEQNCMAYCMDNWDPNNDHSWLFHLFLYFYVCYEKEAISQS